MFNININTNFIHDFITQQVVTDSSEVPQISEQEIAGSIQGKAFQNLGLSFYGPLFPPKKV